MKLELKHLAPYLPHGLKGYKDFRNIPLVKEMTNGNIIAWLEDDFQHKPILRPLSDLTKEIEHNGEILVISKVLYDHYDTDNDADWIEHCDDIGWDKATWTDSPYWMVKYLIKHHFDVFGLIPEGLAIDINTI